MHRVPVIAAGLWLGLLASAAASPFGPAEEAAWAEAEAYWRATPTLCTSISKELVSPGSLDGPEGELVAGRATQPTEPTPCTLQVVEGLSPCEVRSTILHEYGHLLGLGHSQEPGIMNPSEASRFFCEPMREVLREHWVAMGHMLRWKLLRCPDFRGPRAAHCWEEARLFRRLRNQDERALRRLA